MRRRVFLFALLSAVCASRAQRPLASTPPTGSLGSLPPVPGVGTAMPFTLLQVLEMAHRANLTLLAAAQHLSAVQAQEVTSGLRQNPVGVLGAQMFTLSPDDVNGPPFYNVGVQRLFERGNKRAVRLENARSTTSLTRFQLDVERRQIDLAVRQAFSRMVYAQAALRLSSENLENYRRSVELNRIQLQAGVIDQTDFDRIELQLAGFEADLDNAQLTLRQGSIALQTLLGFSVATDAFSISGTLDPPSISATLDDLRRAALAARPDLKAAEAQVAVDASAVKLAYANGTADPTVEGEYERSGHANTVGGSINIPLRLFDRNQGEKARAAYELQSSQLALTAARNQVLSDVDTAWAAYQTAKVQAARYRDKYLAEAAHVRDNVQFSYRNGNTTLLDYLSALADYRQVNLTALNADLQLLLALEQVSYASQMEILP